jgi:hypothetical protein
LRDTYKDILFEARSRAGDRIMEKNEDDPSRIDSELT